MAHRAKATYQVRSRAFALFAAFFVTGLSLGNAGWVSAAGPYGPDYRFCGSFQAEYHIRVYETHMSCRKALRIQREYWLGPMRRKTVVNGGSGAAGYVLLKRFPGWRCGSGAGGGQCAKGRKVAAYQD